MIKVTAGFIDQDHIRPLIHFKIVAGAAIAYFAYSILPFCFTFKMSKPQSNVVANSATAPAMYSSGLFKVLGDVVAGTCGGFSVTLVGHPFDTLKVRLQTQPTNPPIYNGLIDCFKKTIRWEGPTGLYKGVSAPLAGQLFFRASLFTAFGASQRYLATNPDGTTRKLTTSDFYKAGAMTGFAAAFTEGPIDFYKSQLQVQIIRAKSDPNYKPPFTSTLDVVKQTIRANGIRGPYQGLPATILRNIPGNSVYLGSFQVMKEVAAERLQCKTSELPSSIVLSAAGFGGILYWVTVYPIDVIKSAQMSDSIHKAERVYPRMLMTAQKLFQDGGVKRFYRGFSPCIVRAAPANAAMLLTVEKVSNYLFAH